MTNQETLDAPKLGKIYMAVPVFLASEADQHLLSRRILVTGYAFTYAVTGKYLTRPYGRRTDGRKAWATGDQRTYDRSRWTFWELL